MLLHLSIIFFLHVPLGAALSIIGARRSRDECTPRRDNHVRLCSDCERFAAPIPRQNDRIFLRFFLFLLQLVYRMFDRRDERSEQSGNDHFGPAALGRRRVDGARAAVAAELLQSGPQTLYPARSRARADVLLTNEQVAP